MNLLVEFHEDFEPEFDALSEEVQDELLAHASLLETFGPQLGRPHVDTLNGSQHAIMKELRFNGKNFERKAVTVATGTTTKDRATLCRAASS